jgi:hypothetical protein
MALKKKLKEIEDELEYWENYPAQNWIGKWGKQIRIDNAKSKKKKLENELIKRRKNKNEE